MLKLDRFPKTKSQALKAWNAADELLIETVLSVPGDIGIINDGFGYLTCHAVKAKKQVQCVTDLKSQAVAIQTNLKTNGLSSDQVTFLSPLITGVNTVKNIGLKIPKSIELFELFLKQAHDMIDHDGVVYCGFMTKYFSPSLIKIAEKYFENVGQSRAKKKARLLILSQKKTVQEQSFIQSIQFEKNTLKQYYGVFSSKKIDIATQFLLRHMTTESEPKKILDLACGNGIIAQHIGNKYPKASLHVIDDSYLALRSAQLNLPSTTYFHHHYELTDFESDYFDWIVTNPPFHFGHSIDISIPLGLFKQSARILTKGGRLTIVANSNLGYHNHLKSWFQSVEINKSNAKFHIYECIK